MKGFGFYTRMMAICWLFGLVIGNFGEAWLSPDNVLIRREAPPAPPKSLVEVAAEALPPGAKPIVGDGYRRDERIMATAGWGEAGPDQADTEMDPGEPADLGEDDPVDWAND